jgi:hypothetical protein
MALMCRWTRKLNPVGAAARTNGGDAPHATVYGRWLAIAITVDKAI